MNAPLPLTVADTGRAGHILTAREAEARAVFEQALRSAHMLHLPLHDLVGTIIFQASRTVLTADQRVEAAEAARLYGIVSDALAAVASGQQQAAA